MTSVVRTDAQTWSTYGAERSQPAATASKGGRPDKRLKQAKTVATGCDQLPTRRHGKEGVDGSSPSEGSKRPANRHFLLSVLNCG